MPLNLRMPFRSSTGLRNKKPLAGIYSDLACQSHCSQDRRHSASRRLRTRAHWRKMLLVLLCGRDWHRCESTTANQVNSKFALAGRWDLSDSYTRYHSSIVLKDTRNPDSCPSSRIRTTRAHRGKGRSSSTPPPTGFLCGSCNNPFRTRRCSRAAGR